MSVCVCDRKYKWLAQRASVCLQKCVFIKAERTLYIAHNSLDAWTGVPHLLLLDYFPFLFRLVVRNVRSFQSLAKYYWILCPCIRLLFGHGPKHCNETHNIRKFLDGWRDCDSCVCMCVSVFELKTFVARESTRSAYVYIHFKHYNNHNAYLLKWAAPVVTALSFENIACLYNKTNIASKPPPPSDRWWLISVQRIRMSDLVKVLSVLGWAVLCVCICCFDADQWPFSKMNAT